MRQFILENDKGEVVADGGDAMTTNRADALVFDERDNMEIKVRWFSMHMGQPVKSVEL